jgi:hypothetical protein
MELRPNETDTPWIDGFVDERGRPYACSDSGKILFGSLTGLLHQQAQYASRYIDGEIEGYPNLGQGLDIDDDPNNYHAIAVAPEHAQELVDRIIAYRGLAMNLIPDAESRHMVPPTDEQRQQFGEFLRERNLPVPER